MRYGRHFGGSEVTEGTELAIGNCVRCVVDSDCGSNSYCFQTKCNLKLSEGATCIKPAWCASGECTSNTCGAMRYYGDQKNVPRSSGQRAAHLDKEGTEQEIGSSVRCMVDSDCEIDSYCFQTKCKEKLSEGATCIKPTWCASGECASNTCGAMGGNGDQKNVP